MKHLIALCTTLVIFALPTTFAQQKEGKAIMEKYQAALSVSDLQSHIEYRNISRSGRTQERKLYQYIKRNEEGKNKFNFLLTFTAPADVKGTGTLTWQHVQSDDDQWLYLPAVRSARRISPGRKGDRFMGTEITFEDLSAYLSEPIEKYQYNLVREESKMDHMCYVIEATPMDEKEKKNSAYSRRLVWITKDHLVNVFTVFYDKKGDLIKEFEAWDIKEVNPGHYRAYQASMKNMKTGNRTEITYSDMKMDQGLEDNLFTQSYLESL